MKAKLAYSKRKKQKRAKERQEKEKREREEQEEAEVRALVGKKEDSVSGKETSETRPDSPFKLKPTWKSKSRQSSQKKSARKRTRSNKISRRRRKFSNSGEETVESKNNASPFLPKVPQNTKTKGFYTKMKSRKRNQLAKEEISPKKYKSRSKKKKSTKNFSSRKKKIEKTESAEIVKNKGDAFLGSNATNLLIGDKNNEISQMYSQLGFDFGSKSVIILKTLKLGFDVDYITGIETEYLVGNRAAVDAFCENGEAEVIKVEDPAGIKGICSNSRFAKTTIFAVETGMVASSAK